MSVCMMKYNIVSVHFIKNHVFCEKPLETSVPWLSSGTDVHHSSSTMKNEFISGGSVLNHRLPVTRDGRWASQGHLSPERQISVCQRAGSFWKASCEKRKKKTRPPLSNKLIKSYPNQRAKNLTHSSGLWAKFREKAGG